VLPSDLSRIYVNSLFDEDPRRGYIRIPDGNQPSEDPRPCQQKRRDRSATTNHRATLKESLRWVS